MHRIPVRVPASVPPSLILLVALVLTSSGTFGAQVPTSAEAFSMQLPAELLDHIALTFAFPEMPVCYAPQVLVLASSGYGGSGGLGVAAGRNWYRGFALAGHRAEEEPVLRTHSKELQAGFAAGGDVFRVGAVGRAYLQSEASSSFDSGWYPDEFAESAEDVRLHRFEGAIGVGFGRRVRVDAAVESRWSPERFARFMMRDSDGDTTAGVVLFERKNRPLVSALIRAELPLGDDGRLTAAGRWGGRRQVWNGHLYGRDGSLWADSVLAPGGYNDEWFAGIALSFPGSFVDRWICSGRYRSARVPFVSTGYQDAAAAGSRDERTAEVGLSLRKGLFRGIEGIGGISATYSWNRESSTMIGTNRGIRTSSDKVDRITDTFSWGAVWAWRHVRMCGAVSTNLQIAEPLVMLDARLLF